jgi:hypothetical protein
VLQRIEAQPGALAFRNHGSRAVEDSVSAGANRKTWMVEGAPLAPTWTPPPGRKLFLASCVCTHPLDSIAFTDCLSTNQQVCDDKVCACVSAAWGVNPVKVPGAPEDKQPDHNGYIPTGITRAVPSSSPATSYRNLSIIDKMAVLDKYSEADLKRCPPTRHTPHAGGPGFGFRIGSRVGHWSLGPILQW